VHAFYSLTRAELTQTLKALVQLRAANATTADLGPLSIHPVLAQQGVGGAMAQGLGRIVLQFAGSSNLTRFTAMSSASLFSHPQGGEARFWNFLGFDVNRGTLNPMNIPTLQGGVTMEKFSVAGTDPLRGTFEEGTTSADNMNPLGNVDSAKAAGPADLQKAYTAALKIENPNVHSPNTIDCASCHVAQAARQLVGEADPFHLSDTEGAAFRGAPPSTTPVVNDSLKALNIHAFSYRDAHAMINQRIINETTAVVAFVNTNVRKTSQ
jgi:hypothetical protein